MHEPVYIIAEIGINHNGSIENCFKMIDAAVEAGCNAVKFQLFKAKYLYPQSAGSLDWKNAEKEYSYNIYEAAERFELPEDWIDKLMNYSEDREIDFLSSVSDRTGVDLLAKKGIKRIKLSSYTITNIPLIDHCAKTALPIIMSTGGATLSEIEEAVTTVSKYHNNLTILHCSIKYPTDLTDCNLGVIETLRVVFPTIDVGYSDHTIEISDAAVQAVYLGASVIEKHITRNKKMEGPDHFFALEPAELRKMVRDIRQAELSYIRGDFKIEKSVYGSTAKVTYSHEKYLRDFAYMCLFSAKDIKEGEIITDKDIAILRPGKKKRGLEPKYLKLFEEYKVTAKRNIVFEEPITWDAIL